MRSKRIHFSNIRFLTSLKLEESKFRNLKRFLILSSRILFLLALLYGIFGANITPDLTEEGQKYQIIFIDNSPSINLENEQGQSLQELAIRKANNLLVSGKDLGYVINGNEFLKEGLYLKSKKDEVSNELGVVKNNAPTRRMSDYINRYNQISEIADLSSDDIEVSLISDFQKNVDLEQLKDSIKGDITLYKVTSKREYQTNFVIDSIWLDNPLPRVGETISLKIKVNAINEKELGGSLKVFIQDTEVSTAEISNQVVEVSFILKEEGVNYGRIELQDQISFDNKYHFVIDATPQIDICVVSDQLNGGFVSRVFGNEEAFKVNVQDIDNLKIDKLFESDFIVIENIKDDSKGVFSIVDELLQKGKDVMIIPSVDFGNDEASIEWIENQLGAVTLLKEDSVSLSPIERPSFKEPIFRDILESSEVLFTSPEGRVKFSKISEGTRLLKLITGEPFLIKKEVAEGELYFLNSVLNNQFTNLHKHALFVPIMYKVAINATTMNEQLAYRMGERWKVNGEFEGDETIEVEKDNVRYGCEYTIADGEGIILNSLTTNKGEGIYHLIVDDSLLTSFAVNYDKSESVLEYYSTKDIISKMKASNLKVLEVNNQTLEQDTRSSSSETIPLWKYSLTLALLFLLVEISLIKYLK